MLREKRIAKGYSLRKFAEAVGISPTYLSLVEKGKADKAPTVERVRVMAELLGENANVWIAMSGRMPDDVPEIIRKQPLAMPELLRAAQGLTAEQLKKLTEQARRQSQKGDE